MQAIKKRWKAVSRTNRRLAVIGGGLMLAAGGVSVTSAHADTTNCNPAPGIACWKVNTPSGFVQLNQFNSAWDVTGSGLIPNGECVWVDVSHDGGYTWNGWVAYDCSTHIPYNAWTGTAYDGVGYVARACTQEPTNGQYYCTDWH
jgi:hypothetical protein